MVVKYLFWVHTYVIVDEKSYEVLRGIGRSHTWLAAFIVL